MTSTDDVVDALRAEGRAHPLVAWALHALSPQLDGSFAAPAALRATLADKLGAIGDDRERLAATFGLVALASFLADGRASPQAAAALGEAVADRLDDVRRAVDALGLGDDAAALLGASAFTVAAAPAVPFAPRKEPGAGEARGGPLARATFTPPKK